ncbi:ABC transporter substrate-binding protein [Bosea sp. ASV33]|uniref:ABC transporter substrate-binding protein n=1 Tax=Bosea sp. ASV33 TaxID=2795106 RepID=UPI0018EC7400|nr:ABC transporter substrate-binding protein [Bosea sp. ASV33]
MKFSFAFAISVLALGTSGAVAAGKTQYPLTLENCGRKITFDKAPERAVSIGQNSTEILLSLGVADKMVGTAVWVGPVLENLKAANEKVPRISNNQPSFEGVVKNDPDLVAAQFVFDVGPNGVVGKREQFEELGVATYVSPGDCAAKDNSMRDGSRSKLFSMDSIYQEIGELARIFDVQDRGEAFVAELKQREAKAIASVAGGKAATVSLVFWFSSSNVNGDAWMAGKNGAPGYITQVLGAKNPIQTEEEWPAVSWESIASHNPTAIIVGTMDRRKFPADDPKVKIDFMEKDAVVGKLDAVKNKRFIELSAQAMNPTIRTIDGIETVAAGLKRLKLVD